MSAALPWATLMRLGLGTLRLPPDVFWAMTPHEFTAVAGVLAHGTPPMDRDGLARLMALHPDAHGQAKEMDDEPTGQ